MLIGLFPAVARAGQVAEVMVTDSSPSSAAGALTDYTVTFTTSSTGALSANLSTITIDFPEGTGLTSVSGTVEAGGQGVGYCSESSSLTVSCSIDSEVGAEAHVSIELYGVRNPGSASDEERVEVQTSSDIAQATSKVYSVTPEEHVTPLAVRVEAPAEGALTVYEVEFRTSSTTGALSGTAGSRVTVTFSEGTGLGSVSGSVDVGDEEVGACERSGSTLTVSCSIFSYSKIAVNTAVSVELGKVRNPGSAEPELEVVTSSDTLPAVGKYTLTQSREPGTVSVFDEMPSSAAGATTDYRIEFKTSSTGALSGAAGSALEIDFPAGTGLGSLSGTVENEGLEQVGSCGRSSSTTVSCEISGSVAANERVTVDLDGVRNPSSAEEGETVKVSTTSDTGSRVSLGYPVSPAGHPGLPVVEETSSAAGARAAYRVTFATSSETGGLSGTAGSQITVTFPSGTEFEGSVSGSVEDASTHQQVGDGSCSVLVTVVTCAITGVVTAGNTLVVELDQVTNTGSAESEPLEVATSSDTLPAVGKYTLTQPGEPGTALVVNAMPSSAAGALTDYGIEFETSSTGALSGAAGSVIEIAFPTGTGLGSLSGTVENEGEERVGSCGRASSTTVECKINEDSKIGTKARVSIELYGVTNPSSASDEERVEVKTSSDTTRARSAVYSVTSEGHVSSLGVRVEAPAEGALTVYTVGFTTSSTGALSGAAGSTVTIVFPAGTGLGSVTGSVENAGGEQIGSCGESNSTTVGCHISGSSEVAVEETVSVELDKVTNTSATGTTALKVSTSSDTAAESDGYTLSAAAQPMLLKVGDTTSAAGALTVYTVEFATSSTGALSAAAGSAVTIDFPKSTGLGSVTGTVEDEGEESVGDCGGSAATTVSCSIDATVEAGETLTVVLQRVVNPNTVGNEPLKLATTSDTTFASSGFPVTAPSAPVGVTVDNSSPSSAPGALTIYKIDFSTSSTGALSSAAGSQIAIVFPAGTGLSSLSNMSVSDETTGQQVGYCDGSGTLTVTCAIEGVVNAGDSLTVELDGVTNPTVTAPESVKVSTTSDTVAATSAPYGVGAPVVVTGAASNVSQATAFVTGTVDPEDTAVTDCQFEWGPSTSYGQSAACSQVVGSGSSAEPVSAALAGLSPNTTYHYRVVATNGGGTTYGGDETFATPAAVLSMSAPSAFPSAPAAVGSEGATFSGVVDPDGLATTVYFEYGLDPKYSGGGPVTYDQRTPAQTVGSDFAGHAVSASVSGLVPNAVYHVRMVVANGAGTTVGPDQTFTTGQSAAPPPPTIGRTVNVKPVEGLVFVKFPGRRPAQASAASVAHEALTKGEGFVPLTETRQLPVGTEIDARQGTLELLAATGQGHRTNSAKLTGGLFTLFQQRAGLHKGLTTFTLDEGLFPGAPSYESCTVAAASSVGPRARSARLSARVLQRLEATDDHGSFQTRGRYSAATVRGTSWSTADRCDGTFTHVRRGTVDVLDFATRKTTVLKAGQSFLAPAS